MDVLDMVRILKVKKETPTVSTLTLKKKIEANAGQFFMLWIPGFGEKPYASSRLGDELEITVKNVGPFSEKMCSLKRNDLIGIRGPYGDGYFNVGPGNICIVAGGLGIAPLMPVIDDQRGSEGGIKGNLTVILGASTKDELLFTKRIKKSGAELIIATDDGSAGEKCTCHEVLGGIAEKREFEQILCCGPELMMRGVLKIAVKENIPAYFSLERYMKCGIGICGSCSIDPAGLLVCKDGPVFSAGMLQDTEFGRYKRDAAGSRFEL